ncbi:hypothetical protein [Hypericibacter sp.]|uniref:hypothetical protein n=1 Tax=Hypericibacter sp. TaxID=2705401 RepID=UPI003D6D6228
MRLLDRRQPSIDLGNLRVGLGIGQRPVQLCAIHFALKIGAITLFRSEGLCGLIAHACNLQHPPRSQNASVTSAAPGVDRLKHLIAPDFANVSVGLTDP